jgi:hypothetical protein
MQRLKGIFTGSLPTFLDIGAPRHPRSPFFPFHCAVPKSIRSLYTNKWIVELSPAV